MDTILVNKLPTRTWNRLGVNETALLWDEAGTVDGGTEVLTGDGRLELSVGAPYTRKRWRSPPRSDSASRCMRRSGAGSTSTSGRCCGLKRTR